MDDDCAGAAADGDPTATVVVAERAIGCGVGAGLFGTAATATPATLAAATPATPVAACAAIPAPVSDGADPMNGRPVSHDAGPIAHASFGADTASSARTTSGSNCLPL